MKKSTKFLSLILALFLLTTSVFLFSCEKPSGEETETVVESAYIIKTEIKDGCIWVTYSNDPDNPVNIGAMGYDGKTSSPTSLSYLPLPDGTYGVTAGNSLYLDTIVIPETYNGKAVSTILNNAFNGATHLKNITIPSTVTKVEDNAFYECGNIEYNEYDNAMYLGNTANPYLILVKAKDATITRCTVNEATVAICDSAFYGCNELSYLTIPNSVKCIGSYAFKDCASLYEINFPEGNTAIGKETFDGCASLTKITIPASVETIDNSAFKDCTALAEVTFAENSALVSIANAAFSSCKSLKAISIPKNVKSIGDNKASGATNGVFHSCSSLEKVTFADDAKLIEIGNYAFSNTTKLTSISLPNVKLIGGGAFQRSGLTSIELPASLTTISNSAFFSCKSLKSVTFGENLNKIGYQAFADCSVLNNVVIPASVRVISQAAFNEDCKALDSVEIKDATNWYDLATMNKIDSAKFSDKATAANMLKEANTYSAGFGK